MAGESRQPLMKNHDVVRMRVAIVGDSCTGKTTLVQHMSEICATMGVPKVHGPEPSGRNMATVGVDMAHLTRPERDENGVQWQVQVWDCGGLHQYVPLTQTYITNSEAVLLCVNDDQPSTIQSALDVWIPLIVAGSTRHPKLVALVTNRKEPAAEPAAEAVAPQEIPLVGLIKEDHQPPKDATAAVDRDGPSEALLPVHALNRLSDQLGAAFPDHKETPDVCLLDVAGAPEHQRASRALEYMWVSCMPRVLKRRQREAEEQRERIERESRPYAFVQKIRETVSRIRIPSNGAKNDSGGFAPIHVCSSPRGTTKPPTVRGTLVRLVESLAPWKRRQRKISL